MTPSFLLAIPVFNEERYVGGVLDEARRYGPDILVVDDGSTDATPELLQAYGSVEIITHPENRGYGKSLADAFAFAARRGYDWLITMDCDEQHEPSYIPGFMAEALRDDADVISGTRYPNGHGSDAAAPADRREINRRIVTILNDRLRLGITDAFCGFKAYRVSSLRHFRVTVPGYAMPMQWWVQVWRAGLRVRELPVRLIYNDPTRHFGGRLDDPVVRFNHYLDVFEAELAEAGTTASMPSCDRARASHQQCLPCR